MAVPSSICATRRATESVPEGQSGPDAVVLAAAKVGGIMANSTYPVEFLEDNLRIQLSVIAGAHAAGVGRLLFLGSSCIYPKLAPQPITRGRAADRPAGADQRGRTRSPRSPASCQVQSYRRQYGASYISAMPTNLYGPGDNFDLETSHVLPALIRRFHEAKRDGPREVTLWGTRHAAPRVPARRRPRRRLRAAAARATTATSRSTSAAART